MQESLVYLQYCQFYHPDSTVAGFIRRVEGFQCDCPDWEGCAGELGSSFAPLEPLPPGGRACAVVSSDRDACGSSGEAAGAAEEAEGVGGD